MNELNEIEQELNELNSLLLHISKTMPFTVPENYFEDNVIYSKENPFAVPDNYFSELPQLVTEKINKPRFVFSRWIFLRAAAALLLIFVGVYGYYVAVHPSIDRQIRGLSATEIETYILYTSDDLDAEKLLQYSETSATHLPVHHIDKQTMVNYLNEYGWN